MTNGDRCPCCLGTELVERVSSKRIDQQIELRSRFVRRRLNRRPAPYELMDLTEFMHGGPGRLLICEFCGVVSREEDAQPRYDDDSYDLDLLEQLYPAYLDAFLQKERRYRDLLPPTADVVEVGSHLGAFLEAAERWNWRPIGIDSGRDTTAFARSRGVTVIREPVENTRLRARSADAVFIWNCFEQLSDPIGTLEKAHRTLKPHGLIVVRVPNVSYYQKLSNSRSAEATKQLGYNNLLGFPYRTGYTAQGLEWLLKRGRFQPVAAHDSGLLVFPVVDPPAWVGRQVAAVRTKCCYGEDVGGPWIEIVGRRVESE